MTLGPVFRPEHADIDPCSHTSGRSKAHANDRTSTTIVEGLGPACVLILAEEDDAWRDKEIRLRPRLKMVHA